METTAEVNSENQHLEKKGEDVKPIQRRKFSVEPNGISILVVDNDQVSLSQTKKLFQTAGYSEVALVDSGERAVQMLENIHFDVILSDIHIPEMDGFQLLQSVKQMHDEITVFVMSSTQDLDIVYQCLRAGADHYILKPLKENDLRGLWQIIWRKRRENKVLKQLSDETHKNNQLKEKTIQLESELNSLKDQVDELIQIPIRIIGKEVEKLLAQSDLPAELIISTILSKLNKCDLYQQAFQKFLNECTDLEPISRRWLIDELTNSSIPNSSKKTPIEWVRVVPDSSKILSDWDFDVWSYTHEQLLSLCEDMINDFQLLEKFSIPPIHMRNFLVDVCNNYSKKNPYHNFRHAFDVTQTIYLMLTNCNAASYLSYHEILAILIAGMVHDLGHQGLNNSFLIATGSPLAMTYNDKSVLENYHAALAFSLLKKPENDIFLNLSSEQRKEVRSMIINCVLATDLSLHMDILGKWNNCISNGFNKDNKEHRVLLAQILIKCADIANPGKNFDQAKYWAQMVQEEFFCQGDLEKENKLSISPFMDRDHPALPRMQLNFLDFLVSPLFASVKPLLPKIEYMCGRIEEAKKKWTNLEDSTNIAAMESSEE